MKTLESTYRPRRKGKPVALACALGLLALTACRKNPFPDRPAGNELVVLAEITAGQPLKIPISKSIQVGNGDIIAFEKVKSASVTILRADGRSWVLNLNNSSDYATDPASVYTSYQRPAYNATYTLKVQDPLSGTVTAQTTIPGRVHISGFDTSSTTRSGFPVLKCRFTLRDPVDTTNYYIFEALKQLIKTRHTFYWAGKKYDYNTPEGRKLFDQVKDQPGVKLNTDTLYTNNFQRLGLFTDDNNVDNFQITTNPDSAFRRIFLNGRIFSGGRPYNASFFIDKRHFTDTEEKNRGRVLIQVKAVSPELYNYLFYYEKYKSDIGSLPPSQLYSPPGNIQNGLGIFGGSSKYERVYYFDTLL